MGPPGLYNGSTHLYSSPLINELLDGFGLLIENHQLALRLLIKNPTFILHLSKLPNSRL